MGLLIKQGEIVTAAERYVADLYVDGGKVVAIGPGLEPRSAKDQVLDASGRFVFPGFVDPHVHLALPVGGTVSADDFEAGTAAGVAGGTTAIMDFVVPDRGQSLLEALRAWRERAKSSVADYAFHMGISGWDERTAAEMHAVVAEHGIPSFKVLMAYKGTLMVDDGELYQVMKHAARLGAVVLVHAENGDAVAALQQELRARGDLGPEFHPVSRPSCLEGEATHRALVLAKLHGTEVYIVHLTCREAVEALARARAAGERCYGETCPQYLLLDDSVYDKPDFEGAAYVMSPPIRPKGHQDYLWNALASGLIQVVATDHCPFRQKDQKIAGKDAFTKIPNGAAGVEDRLSLMYSFGAAAGRITLNQFVDVCCTQPAKIFGLYPRKGVIAVGSDADLVVYDPTGTRTLSAKTHHQAVDRNIYEGMQVKGRIAATVAAGRVRYQDGDLRAERGAGRYIKRG
jgi:dihydropyrimidinase